jgi:hypothetical protein
MSVLSLVQLISNQGVINGAVSWIIISIVTSGVTGLIAEALQSAVPSPFRWIGAIIDIIMNLT